jgi:hypothetical protein
MSHIGHFFMEIIIIMAWSIWMTRNDWIFSNIDLSVERCKAKFIYEFSLVLFRVKSGLLLDVES